MGNNKIYPPGTFPKPVAGKFKYSSKGDIKPEVFLQYNIPIELAIKMAGDANMALSNNTKSNYNTVKNNIKKCEEAMQTDLYFPWNTKETLVFLAYLLYTREVTSKTANCQLSGVRMAHLEIGLECPILRPPIVKLLLQGKQHWDSVSSRLKMKPKKAPVSLDMMLVIKRNLFEANWSSHKKFLFWSVSTLLWNGSLRVHEALSRLQNTFDPDQTLLLENIDVTDVKIGGAFRSLIKILLKLTKEDRVGCNTILEVFGNDTFLCPVKALRKYMKISGTQLKKGFPLYIKKDGHCYTGKCFNADLAELTTVITDGSGHTVRSHCMRSGVPSELAKAGASDQEISGQGRWTSEAWKAYCKLHRTKRLNLVDRIITKIM